MATYACYICLLTCRCDVELSATTIAEETARKSSDESSFLPREGDVGNSAEGSGDFCSNHVHPLWFIRNWFVFVRTSNFLVMHSWFIWHYLVSFQITYAPSKLAYFIFKIKATWQKQNGERGTFQGRKLFKLFTMWKNEDGKGYKQSPGVRPATIQWNGICCNSVKHYTKREEGGERIEEKLAPSSYKELCIFSLAEKRV